MNAALAATKPREVALFITCVSDAMYPHVGVAVVGVLRHLGIEVQFPPGQTCCGQPAFNCGHHAAAKKVAKQFIKAMRDADVIISPSGSCTAMVRHTYPQLLADEPEWLREARLLGERCYEFSQFLVDVLGVEDLGARYEAHATIHRSCHMSRLLGVVQQPERLLSHVRGLRLTPLQRPQDCCGFGGTFSVKMPEVSIAMADSKIDDILATGADTLIGSDMACLMNLWGRMRRRKIDMQVKHVAEILWEGLKGNALAGKE
jgi:L-lactate dehydrogenase complex protein LldE